MIFHVNLKAISIFWSAFFKRISFIKLKLISFFNARYPTVSLRGPVQTLRRGAEFWVSKRTLKKKVIQVSWFWLSFFLEIFYLMGWDGVGWFKIWTSAARTGSPRVFFQKWTNNYLIYFWRKKLYFRNFSRIGWGKPVRRGIGSSARRTGLRRVFLVFLYLLIFHRLRNLYLILILAYYSKTIWWVV